MCRGSSFQPAPFFLRAFVAQNPAPPAEATKDSAIRPEALLPANFFSLAAPGDGPPPLVVEEPGKVPELVLDISVAKQAEAPAVTPIASEPAVRVPDLNVGAEIRVPEANDDDDDEEEEEEESKPAGPSPRESEPSSSPMGSPTGLAIAVRAAFAGQKRHHPATPASPSPSPCASPRAAVEPVVEHGYPFPVPKRRAQLNPPPDLVLGKGPSLGAEEKVPSPPPLPALWWGWQSSFPSPLGRSASPPPGPPAQCGRYPMATAD